MTRHFAMLLATTNRGKILELRQLFRDLPVDLISLDEALPGRPPVVEDGLTFEDNARIKARAASRDAMMLTLAEDSGLEVDALGGRPGVRSARFAKDGATDAENNAELLSQLRDTEDDLRAARFRCCMIVVDPWAESEAAIGGTFGAYGLEIVTEGRCEGVIAQQSRGSGGFGYDPLFLVNGFERTMAELDEAEKNRVSHRARAAEAMRPRLAALVAKRIRSSAQLLPNR